jgi:hypothetical protein
MSSAPPQAAFDATFKGDAAALRNVLRSGTIDVNGKSAERGQTLLYIAARFPASTECARVLLEEQRANVNVLCSDGCIALHGATWGGRPSSVALLKRHGANTNVTNKHDETPATNTSNCQDEKMRSVMKKLLDMPSASFTISDSVFTVTQQALFWADDFTWKPVPVPTLAEEMWAASRAVDSDPRCSPEPIPFKLGISSYVYHPVARAQVRVATSVVRPVRLVNSDVNNATYNTKGAVVTALNWSPRGRWEPYDAATQREVALAAQAKQRYVPVADGSGIIDLEECVVTGLGGERLPIWLFIGGSPDRAIAPVNWQEVREKGFPEMARHFGAMPINPRGDEFKTVAKSFEATWDAKKGPCPKVTTVLSLTPSPAVQQQFSDRLVQICMERGPGNENVRQLYHGTGVHPNCCLATEQIFCDEGCGVCGITKGGFDPARIGKGKLSQAWTPGAGFRRFGHGFYFGYNSSKSNDYSVPSERVVADGSKQRSMLVCAVALGRESVFKKDDPTLRDPPAGFDSVVGEAGHGNLNYPEAVIYRADACIAKYAVIYTLL